MIPTVQQWHAVTWAARQRWADRHGLSVREAQRAVYAGKLPGPRVVTREPDEVPEVPFDLALSLAGDRDPVVVALRRAAATGLQPTHPEVLAGLPRLGLAS